MLAYLLLTVTSLLIILYIILILILIRGLQNLQKSDQLKEPKVSVIVSFHNEEHNANKLLSCLFQQNYPADKTEFIFVNDRSADKTPEILKSLSQNHKNVKILNISDLKNDFAPKKRALTEAISQAGGEILFFTDADGRPGPDWISSTLSFFTDKTGMVIGYAPYQITSPYDRFKFILLGLEYFSHAAIAAATCGMNYPSTCVGTNLAFRKKVFEQLGGYGRYKHIHTGDDDLFLQRVREETNWRINYAITPDSFVYNAPPADLKKFFHQRLRYASKGFLYPFRFTLILILYYLLNLFLLSGIVSALILNMFFLQFLALFGIKILFDYIFLKRAAQKLKQQNLLFAYIPAALLHGPYILFFGLIAQFHKFEWAGIKQ